MPRRLKALIAFLVLGILFFFPTVESVLAKEEIDFHFNTVKEFDRWMFEQYPELREWQWEDDSEENKVVLQKENQNNVTSSYDPFTKGAVLVTKDALASSLGSLGHVAIVYSYSRNLSSYMKEGVQLYKNSSYGGTYENWGSIFPDDEDVATEAAEEAHPYIGKKYNYFFINKLTKNSFYCSQLVWKAYHDVGINLAPWTPYAAPTQLWTNTDKLPLTLANYGMPER